MKEPIRILICGHQGRMGQLAHTVLSQDPRFQVVAGVGRTDDLAEAISRTQPHVGLELTDCNGVWPNSLTLIQQGVRPVIGASGLSTQQCNTLESMVTERHSGGVIAPNFSIAANLMMACCRLAAPCLPQAEIIEMHHWGKKDAPSGTAQATAEIIQKARKTSTESWPGQILASGARGATLHKVPTHSVRLPGILAKQQVLFSLPGEVFTLDHHTQSREAFAPGILLACAFASTCEGLYRGLDHILFEESARE